MLFKFDGELDTNINHYLFDMDPGGVEESLDFTMGPDTSAYGSCSATLKGELFVFGGQGSSNNKQVVFINKITIKRDFLSDQ